MQIGGKPCATIIFLIFAISILALMGCSNGAKSELPSNSAHLLSLDVKVIEVAEHNLFKVEALKDESKKGRRDIS